MNTGIKEFESSRAFSKIKCHIFLRVAAEFFPYTAEEKGHL